MADIPLKPEDEMTNDLVGAVENIAQSVKAGSRDFTKSFTGLTTAIKRLQTTLVNAIKAIKIQVVAKPEKVQKAATKDKSTSTKEVVKEKETKTEVAPEKKAKTPKVDPNAALDEKVLGYIRKNPEASGGRIEKDIGSGEGTLSSPELKDSLERLIRQNKILEDSIGGSSIRMYSANPEIKSPEIKSPEIKAPDAAQKKEPKQKAPKAPSQPKVVDPIEAAEKENKKKRAEESSELLLQTRRTNAQLAALRLQNAMNPPPKAPPKEKPKPVDPQEKERVAKEKAREKEVQKRQEKVKPVKISSLIEGINQTGAAWSKMISGIRKSIVDTENIRKAEENKVAKTGKEGTKDFVGPPKKLFDKNERKASDAAEKEKDDESERREKADREASNAEKTLRTYFRKQEEGQASEEAKAANDLVKQQEQAARNLEQANQKTQKELDGLIGVFQRLTPLFKGPLVNFGLKMIAKGIGYKQPKTMSKGGDVSYLADGGQAMKPKGTDTQPAMLTPGEFVVNKKASEDPENRKQLESINSGKNKKKVEYHSSGGSVGGVGYYAAGGPIVAAAGVAFVAVGSAINSVAKSFAIASEAVSSFAGAVQKANPALMEQVGLAMDDLQAVVGRALSPAITMLIPLIRQFADYVDYSAKKFAPAIESIIKITKELMSPLLELGATVANALMPFTKLLVLQFGGIVKIIIPIIDLLSSLFETVTLLMGSLGDSEFLFGVFNNSIEILSRAVSIVAGTIQLIIGAFVVGVAKMIEVLGTLVNTISFGFAGESIEDFGEKAGKVGEKLYNKSLENFKAVGEGKPKRFKAGEMSGDKGLQKDSSYGAAVRQVQSMSIVGIGDEMRKNALMAGIGQKSQEESLNQIEKNTGELVDLFKDLKMPQNTGAGRIVGPNPHAPAVVNENMGAVSGTVGTRWGAITPIN
tara:strand:+ start:2047 stop:4818 length:2772 start_codon:yes stop_codon:yes gene_type:complete